MEIVFFLGSALLLAIGFIIGMFTTEYYMPREGGAIEISPRTSDRIRRFLSSLECICDSITRGKGERGDSPDRRFNLLEDIHDSIYKTIIKDLKSVLPEENKNV